MQQIKEPDDNDIYTGIGTELRAERLRRQLSIADVSGTLRIQKSHLSALEEGRTNDLPGPTYAIGFLRTYSDFLGMDGEDIIRQYKTEETLTPGQRRLNFPEPVEEARRPGLTLALISLIVAGAVYGGWIFLERRGMLPIETVAEPPQRLAPYQAAIEQPAKTPAISPAVTEAVAETESTQAAIVTTPETPPAQAAETEIVKDFAAVEPAVVETPTKATAETTAETIAPEKLEPGEGERAAAADVSGLANTNDATEAAAAKIDTRPDAKVVDDKPATSAAASTPEPAPADRPTMTRPTAVLDTSPMPAKREGSDVDTAPTMPLIQATIAPPPPPAAPAAPTRPLTEGGSDTATSGDEGRASLATASEGLGYRPQAYGAANRDVRVVLRARAESWVQVQGANNELLLTRMLRPGDSYHAPNRNDLVLMTGNAGAIEIMVDGEALGTLGPMGQVRRNIRLNADHLRDTMHPPGSGQGGGQGGDQ